MHTAVSEISLKRKRNKKPHQRQLQMDQKQTRLPKADWDQLNIVRKEKSNPS